MSGYPPSVRAEAALLYWLEGYGYSRIAKRYGCSPTTVRRWVHPEYDDEMRESSRRRKEAVVGACLDCGGPTRYNGHRGIATSPRCSACARKRTRVWTKEKIIEAIQRWAREHDGVAPSSGDWLHRGEYHPAATAVYSADNAVFNSWSEAIRAAGFEPKRVSPGPGTHWWPRDEARKLWEAGWTPKEIGEKYGVTGGAISNVFGPMNPQPKKAKPRTREERIAALRKALAKTDS